MTSACLFSLENLQRINLIREMRKHKRKENSQARKNYNINNLATSSGARGNILSRVL